jgi:hypothetical protein
MNGISVPNPTIYPLVIAWSPVTVAVVLTGFSSSAFMADSFAQLGKLFGAEHEQSDSENHQQMHRLKQSFKHRFSFG